ncbi:hypothetical protein Klosneuvirus_3_296 [Klosneuvirus KNV1]|uniref:Uncharacterized protein n=1 Tax=Klosneuvirus KNV1 TaxID=1977640 RepID=A0A1V0SKG5_9VIRU|nr:hypothetical protein Klosneuvirus_3_296 [Klosneuvirus KNV1]
MSKNKLKHKNPSSMLENYCLDKSAVNVLLLHLGKLKIKITLEDNVLYVTNEDGTKCEISKHDYVMSKIDELRKIVLREDNNNLYMSYLFEKMQLLEDKIRDLENENENLRDKISNYRD